MDGMRDPVPASPRQSGRVLQGSGCRTGLLDTFCLQAR